MTTLKAFKPTGKQCNWPGCNNVAVEVNFPIEAKTKHCIKHQLYKLSGRVSDKNWGRDHYREHMQARCAINGTTWSQAYKEVQYMDQQLGSNLPRRELIRRTSQQFQVDHIDGDHSNNNPENLQTLTHRAHKFKTDVMGDSDGWKNKRKKV